MCGEVKAAGDAPELVPLMRMAARLGVPRDWLKEQAETGNVPALHAGTRWLFRPDVVVPVVADMAAPPQEKKGAHRA